MRPRDGSHSRRSDPQGLTDRTTDRRPEERPDVRNRGPPRRPASEMGPAPSPGFTRRLAADAALGDRTARRERAGTNRRSSEASRRGPTLHNRSHRSSATRTDQKTRLSIRTKPVCSYARGLDRCDLIEGCRRGASTRAKVAVHRQTSTRSHAQQHALGAVYPGAREARGGGN